MEKEIDLIKLSVVIPMYNSKNTIIKVLNSIKNQTAYKYIFEIIIVNDGSTDDSLSIVNNYIEENKDMPIIVINQNNCGVSSARNTGMKAAKGDWIALLDSDDVWLTNKIEIQIDTINKHKEIDFLGGDIEANKPKVLFKSIEELYKVEVKDLCLKMLPQTSTAIFKRKIFDEIGGYDENQRYAEDGNYFLRICSNYNYYHLPLQMVIYDGGKPGFGFSGLSANLIKMYEGNIKNIIELKERKLISNSFYIFLRVFYYLKYIRRLIIVKVRNVRGS